MAGNNSVVFTDDPVLQIESFVDPGAALDRALLHSCHIAFGAAVLGRPGRGVERQGAGSASKRARLITWIAVQQQDRVPFRFQSC